MDKVFRLQNYHLFPILLGLKYKETGSVNYLRADTLVVVHGLDGVFHVGGSPEWQRAREERHTREASSRQNKTLAANYKITNVSLKQNLALPILIMDAKPECYKQNLISFKAIACEIRCFPYKYTGKSGGFPYKYTGKS